MKKIEPKYNDGKYKELEYFLKGLRWPLFKLLKYKSKPAFHCSICNYHGPFMDKKNRLNTKCPRCGEVERTRLSMLVINSIYKKVDTSKINILHISPENALRKKFKLMFGSYTSADLHRKDVDYQFDIQDIPFENETFDLVFASHVLEYPEDDVLAISEIRRVLKNNGIAVLPVPILHEKTKDLNKRNMASKMMHEPGLDYFERYKKFFTSVEIFSPESFEEKFNLKTIISNDSKPDIYKSRLLNLVPVCKV